MKIMMTSSIKAINLIFLCFIASIVSCQIKATKIEMKGENPIEYIFKISLDSLHEKIYKQLDINNMILWDSEHSHMVITEISDLFLQPENKYDFYLEPTYYICLSKTYLSGLGDSLEYISGFYMHLRSINDSLTKVNIVTIDPKVKVGRELLPKPPHFVRRDKTIAVEPSTIEEYELLLKIGDLVGERGLPPINIPQK